MSDGEDFGSKILGTLFVWALLIYGVFWVIKKILIKIAENAAPLIGGAVLVLLLVGLAGIVKRLKTRKEAVARWEQTQLAPLLAQLNAMAKLNRSEALLQQVPNMIQAAETRIPQIERRMENAKSNGDALDFNYG